MIEPSPEKGPSAASSEHEHDKHDLFAWFYDVLDKYTKLKTFLSTRRAVLRGGGVLALSPEQCAAAGFMSPMKFNLYQSTLAAAPALMLASLGDLIFEKDTLPAGTLGLSKRGLGIYASNLTFFQSLLIPMSLLILALLAGRMSLRVTDKNAQNIRRNRRAFLYLDGSLGLYSQAIGAFGFSALNFRMTHARAFSDSAHQTLGDVLAFGAGGLLLVFTCWQFFINYFAIPKRLFAVSGYSDRYPPSTFSTTKIENLGPWWTYQLGTVMLGGIIVTMMLGFGIFGSVIVARVADAVLPTTTNDGSMPASPSAETTPLRSSGAATASAASTNEGPIDTAEIQARLSSLDLQACAKGSGPSGRGRAKITLQSSGVISTVEVDEPPFAGTDAGKCIEDHVRMLRLPPTRDGQPHVLRWSFSLD